MNKINPFLEKNAISVDKFVSVEDYSPISYDKNKVSPYTKTRIILLNGAEFEQHGFCISLTETATIMI